MYWFIFKNSLICTPPEMKRLFPFVPFTLGFLGSAAALSGQVEVSVANTSASETAGTRQITLQLSAPAPSGSAVTARVIGISATENQDFSPLAAARVTFAAGSQSQTISVPITNDTLAEPRETFQLFLTEPSGITIPEHTSTHTIVSEDAGIVLPAFFGNGMVLQRDKGAAVWGYSLPGSVVTTTFAGQSLQSTADASGRFQVTFPNLAASAVGRPLVISSPGVPTRTLTNVVVGEVWMAAGQSNMDFPLSFLPTPENNAEIANANDSLLRVFVPVEQARPEPQVILDGDWFSATPGNTADFPALAYYYGKRLRTELGVPVAIIECAWAGQPIEGFVSEEKLETFPEGQGALGTRDFFYGLYKNGEFDSDPRFLPNLAGQLHNGMVAPLAGYGMRGILWYQGEFNAQSFNSDEYGPVLKALAEDFRSKWNDDLPFYYVQLPNYVDPGRSLWINVQNAQRLALNTIPNSGMTVNNDIGDPADIHPVNKSDFADRLVRWPLAKIYGQTTIVPSGPIFKNATRQGSSITVTFDYSQGLKTRDGNALGGFEVRATGGEWVDANATISGQTVVVSSPAISAPVGVRYAWKQNPTTANLANSVNLPASIFEAVPTVNVAEFYRDTFNDTSIASNPNAGGGLANLGTTGDAWVEGLGQISFDGLGTNNRANTYTNADYGLDMGFTLEVDYNIASLALGSNNNQFSFGLFRNYVPSNQNSLNTPSINSSGIGFNLTPNTNSSRQGLMTATAGTSTSTLSRLSPFVTDVGTHRLSLTVTPDGTGGANWSYSYDQGLPVTGNIAVFDFTSSDFKFVAYGRDGSIAKSIQQVRLTTFTTGLPILTVSADPTNEGLIGLFVTFTLSQPSNTDVSVLFNTVDGVALSGQDYLPFTNRVVSFAPGETEFVELLTMVDDAVIEPDETFALNLSNPIGLAISNAVVPLVIVNDDSVLDDFGDSYGLPTAERAIASDGDNDGHGLFLEYAFNLDPTVAASPDYVPGQLLPFNNEPFGLPVLRQVTNATTGATEMWYQYLRRTDSTPKLVYVTEISSDGVNFVPAEPDQVVQVATFWEEVTVIIRCTATDTSRCFARVRIDVEDNDGDGF